jgi:hypothetical protein
MINAVVDGNFGKIEWAYAHKTSNVDAELARVRAALMVCIYTAIRTKIVLSRLGIELVKGKKVFARRDPNPVHLSGNSGRPTHTAI